MALGRADPVNLTALIQKSTTDDPRWLTSRQVLHHATLQLLTIDVPAVVKAMGERMAALLDRSHGRRIQDYDT